LTLEETDLLIFFIKLTYNLYFFPYERCKRIYLTLLFLYFVFKFCQIILRKTAGSNYIYIVKPVLCDLPREYQNRVKSSSLTSIFTCGARTANPPGAPEFPTAFSGERVALFSFLCNVLLVAVCPFVLLLLIIVLSVLLLLTIILSVLLRLTVSDYPFGIFKPFFLLGFNFLMHRKHHSLIWNRHCLEKLAKIIT